jgi:hypothetical protein
LDEAAERRRRAELMVMEMLPRARVRALKGRPRRSGNRNFWTREAAEEVARTGPFGPALRELKIALKALRVLADYWASLGRPVERFGTEQPDRKTAGGFIVDAMKIIAPFPKNNQAVKSVRNFIADDYLQGQARKRSAKRPSQNRVVKLERLPTV